MEKNQNTTRLKDSLSNSFVMICKKCDVPMNVKDSSESKRRGHKQQNISTQYYCPKCDHSEYKYS